MGCDLGTFDATPIGFCKMCNYYCLFLICRVVILDSRENVFRYND